MDLLNNINGITILIAGVFLIPIAAGVLYPATADRLRHSFLSVLGSLEMITGILLTLFVYKLVFLDQNSRLLRYVYRLVPTAKDLMERHGNDFAYHVVFLFLFLFVILIALHLVTAPLHQFIILPLTNRVSGAISKLNIAAKRIISGVWQLPRSIWLVLIVSLALNVYTNVGYSSSAADYIGQSSAYTAINEKVLSPMLGSGIIKKIPVLINDSFREINETFYTDENVSSKVADTKPFDKKITIIEYFNGVTLDEAVLSTEEIDRTAIDVVGAEKDDKNKAYLIYRWISKNIDYDYDKAEAIVTDPSGVSSGSQVAFSERKGICFDYASLYVSMCRAAGLQVRMVTGLGFSGTAWGDHAWNQVYYPAEKRWINVDTTYGSSGHDAFDNNDFTSIHKYADVQQEW